MRRLLLEASKAAVLAAIIGAIIGLATSDFSLEGALFGGIIGALLGAGFAAWIDVRRDEAKRAVRRQANYPGDLPRSAFGRGTRQITLGARALNDRIFENPRPGQSR